MFAEISLNVEASGIWGVVINDDDVEVGIVLFEDAMNVPFVSKIFDIIEWGNDDAERQLLGILAYLVDFLKSKGLFFIHFLKLLAFLASCKGSFDVIFE